MSKKRKQERGHSKAPPRDTKPPVSKHTWEIGNPADRAGREIGRLMDDTPQDSHPRHKERIRR